MQFEGLRGCKLFRRTSPTHNSSYTLEPAVQGDEYESDCNEETRDAENKAGEAIHKVSRTGISNSATESSDEEEGHEYHCPDDHLSGKSERW